MKISAWQNCYDDQWRGLIVPEAHCHPAKFSPGLIRRIFQHCLTRGYLKAGDTVVDPFGGIGGGGLGDRDESTVCLRNGQKNSTREQAK